MDLKFYYGDGTMLSGGEESAIRELVNGAYAVVHGYRIVTGSTAKKIETGHYPMKEVNEPHSTFELAILSQSLATKNNIPARNLQLEIWFTDNAPEELVSALTEEFHYVEIVRS